MARTQCQSTGVLRRGDGEVGDAEGVVGWWVKGKGGEWSPKIWPRNILLKLKAKESDRVRSKVKSHVSFTPRSCPFSLWQELPRFISIIVF